MAYAFNQSQTQERRREAGKSLLLGEDENPSVLTADLMMRRMNLLGKSIVGLQKALEQMSPEEFADFLGKGPPGEFRDLYEAGPDRLSQYLEEIRLGLQIRGFSNRLEALGEAALEWGISKGFGKGMKAMGSSELISELSPYYPGAESGDAWRRQSVISCTDIRVCSFDWR